MPTPDRTAAELAALDEILQVLFWMRGEGLGDDVSSLQLIPWLGVSAARAEELLELLSDKNLVEPVPTSDGTAYRLTEVGVTEGGRRFRDEFSELTRQAHGECSDPDCDCHATGDPAQCSHHQPHDHHHDHEPNDPSRQEPP